MPAHCGGPMAMPEDRTGRWRRPGRVQPVRLRRNRGRKASSTRWLKRQFADAYVQDAKRLGYRSRAAFKLIELDDRHRLLRPGARVVDLGAAPGGWAQVARERVGRRGRVVAVDLREIEPIAGVVALIGDVREEETAGRLAEALGGGADLVLSDMVAPATGHGGADHLRAMALAEAAFVVACRLLVPGGTFVVKLLQGGEEPEFVASLRRRFARVLRVKPPASRAESRELYVVALEFRQSG